MSPYSDQVVVAYPGAGNNLEVRFADACNLANTAVNTGPTVLVGTSSGMPAPATPLDAGFPWWYDVATGDLDKYPDVDLNYRDEVVVAYMTPGSDTASNPGDYLQPVVAVIDYTANATAPTVTAMKVADSMYKWSFGISASKSESKPGSHRRLDRRLFSLLPPGFPAVPQYLCHTTIRSRLLAEPDLECYTIRLPA
jgi:hypothetical protein